MDRIRRIMAFCWNQERNEGVHIQIRTGNPSCVQILAKGISEMYKATIVAIVLGRETIGVGLLIAYE